MDFTFDQQQNIDEALNRSANELHRLADFYRRHGKVALAVQVERALKNNLRSRTVDFDRKREAELIKPQQKTGKFHWLRRPSLTS